MNLRPQRFLFRILAVALLGGGSLLLIAANSPSPSPVYAVAALQGDLARSPDIWVGRTALVRAIIGSRCVTWMGGQEPACASWQPALLDVDAPNAGTALALQGAPPMPLLSTIRQIPVLAALLPAPHVLRPGTIGTFRVRLTPSPAAAHAYQAVLEDGGIILPGS
jgi:hypothetical protein